MKTTILSLILVFGLLSCINAVSGGSSAPDAYANDFLKKYAGKYYNSTKTAAEDKNTTESTPAPKSPASNAACAQTLNKTNDAVSQFAESVGTAKDKWSLLGSIQRLSGQSYSLGFNCNPEDLKLVNSGKVGVNKTQDKACDKLIEIIQPLLIQSPTGASATGGFEQSLNLSQQALGISKKLGDKCKVSLIDVTQEVTEEEEEALVEEYINEEWELEEEEEEEESDDLIIQIVDEEGNLETIYKGSPTVEIVLDDIEQEVEEEEEEEEVEEEEDEIEQEEEEEVSTSDVSFISFVQKKTTQDKPTSNPNPNPNPNPWSDVDYQGKYTTGGAGNYTTLLTV